MDLPDPTNLAPENWTASCVVAALRGQEDFRTADHSTYLHEGKDEELWKRRILWEEDVLGETIEVAPVQDTC